MERRPRLSIVIGVQDADANLAAILGVLDAHATDEIEVLLCAPGDVEIDPGLLSRTHVRLIKGRESALIPELWRDGILAAQTERIGMLTAHCIPDDQWVRVALGLDMESYAAHGGVIDLHEDADAVGAAIHLLRYASVSSPQLRREVSEIAADNAVYCRADILACEDLLPIGFWEPHYHRQFRHTGRKLRVEPDLRCVHANQYSVRQFMAQRRAHGRVFGRMRGEDASPARRFIMLLLSPLSFFVFGVKLSSSIMKIPLMRKEYFRALPWLSLFLLNWTWGECRGYADAAFGHR